MKTNARHTTLDFTFLSNIQMSVFLLFSSLPNKHKIQLATAASSNFPHNISYFFIYLISISHDLVVSPHIALIVHKNLLFQASRSCNCSFLSPILSSSMVKATDFIPKRSKLLATIHVRNTRDAFTF